MPVALLPDVEIAYEIHGDPDRPPLLLINGLGSQLVRWPMGWIEELVAIAEGAASAPVYPLLKRADERHVTMQAYDNPVFVEDMVRNTAGALMDDARVVWLRVSAKNDESIHNHAAFAEVTWSRS